jgi:hypothetical protein
MFFFLNREVAYKKSKGNHEKPKRPHSIFSTQKPPSPAFALEFSAPSPSRYSPFFVPRSQRAPHCSLRAATFTLIFPPPSSSISPGHTNLQTPFPSLSLQLQPPHNLPQPLVALPLP